VVLAVIPRDVERQYGLDAAPAGDLLALMQDTASRHALTVHDLEVQVICALHPGSSAMDCLVCEPLDG